MAKIYFAVVWKTLYQTKNILIFSRWCKTQTIKKRNSRILLLICLVTYSGCLYSWLFFHSLSWTFANCMNMEGLTFFYVLFLRNWYNRTKKHEKRIQTSVDNMENTVKICVMKSSLKIFEMLKTLLFLKKTNVFYYWRRIFLRFLRI